MIEPLRLGSGFGGGGGRHCMYQRAVIARIKVPCTKKLELPP